MKRRQALLVAAAPALWVPAHAALSAADDAELERLLRAGSPRCALVPDEMEGPFPLRSLLAQPEVVRSEIHEGLPGAPFLLRVRVVDAGRQCAPLAGAAVYLWQCDRNGAYSGYDQRINPGQTGKTFLRGVQLADARGDVTFSSIFPGWYRSRITHLHLMVMHPGRALEPRMASAVTTQLAFPADVVRAVYEHPLYPRGQNRTVASNERDMVFADGHAQQLLAMSGSPDRTLYGAVALAVRT